MLGNSFNEGAWSMLKNTDINEGTLYLGKCAGKEILEKIKHSSRSIKIITPYISSEYIRILKRKKHQGLDLPPKKRTR